MKNKLFIQLVVLSIFISMLAIAANATCSDSDGGRNIYVKGTATSSGQGPWADRCSSSTRLLEVWCRSPSSDKPEGYYVTCSAGCTAGKCRPDGYYYGNIGRLSVFKGVTSITFNASVGQRQILIQKSGYQPYSTNVTVYIGETSSVYASLIVIPQNTTNSTNSTGNQTNQTVQSFGMINVTSSPSGSNIYLDTVFKGITNILLTNVDVGTRNIRLTKTGYNDYYTSVNVIANQVSQVNTVLVINSTGNQTNQTNQSFGAIYATSSPSGASVYVDGVLRGISPITIPNVLVGQRNVNYALSGYDGYATTVTVDLGQTTNVNAVLSQSTSFCFDSDGGQSSSTRLLEVWCRTNSSSAPEGYYVDCANGCVSGACV